MLTLMLVLVAVESKALHPVAVDGDWTQLRELAVLIAGLWVLVGYLLFLEVRFTYHATSD